jgi:tRNA dimethylallyltransferase
MQQLIVIEGATASGKTSLGVELAKRLNTVVISADSRQFYRELAIGTAKPTAGEMQGTPHYFIDSHTIQDPVTSARFSREALQLLQNELKSLPFVIVAGGSGMFIDALCIGLDPIPTDPSIQEQLRAELEASGMEPLLTELRRTDPDYFATADTENPSRVLRALEVIRLTGTTFSSWRRQQPPPRPFGVQRFVIDHDREILYSRINRRVDHMIRDGLLEEARSVYPLRHLAPLQTVGYKECFAYFDGAIDLQTCIDQIKQHTRNYAKRQLTWFRRHPESVWIPYRSNDEMADEILQSIDR